MMQINIYSLKNNNEALKVEYFPEEMYYAIDEMHKNINRTFLPIVQINT